MGSDRLIVAQPYCLRPTCFSTYHKIVDGVCEWCLVPLASMTVECEIVAANEAQVAKDREAPSSGSDSLVSDGESMNQPLDLPESSR